QLGTFAIETDAELRSRKERKAEDLAIASLVAEGFPAENIERVGHKRPGFDLRAQRVIDHATGAIEVRRVEVKGYTAGNPIKLEVNEWRKAQQLRETYWLYVAWNPLSSNPELIRIQDPAPKLDHAKREYFTSRVFLFPAQAINQAGR